MINQVKNIIKVNKMNSQINLSIGIGKIINIFIS